MWTLCETDSGRDVPCEVARITSIDIAAVRFSWEREFQLRRFDGVRDDDALIWDRGFMSNARSLEGIALAGYVISASDAVQGIVVVDQELKASRTQPSSAIAYVRYLATAPWNRHGDKHRSRRFHGIGRLLVVHAIAEGIDLGSRGHIGLHSFVASAPFYDRLGFKNLGPDPAERGMSYFELLPEAAHELLAAVKGESC